MQHNIVFFPSKVVVGNKYPGFEYIFVLLYICHFTVQFYNSTKFLEVFISHSFLDSCYIPSKGDINATAEDCEFLDRIHLGFFI